VNQGDAFYFEERYEDAIASYEKAIQINPDDFEGWLGKGKAQRRLKRYEAALESTNKAIQIKPNNFGGWFGRGYALRGLKRFEEALVSYDKAVQIKPDSYYAWNNRAYTLTKIGRYDDAFANFEKALELKPKPNFATLYYNKAYYYILQNQIELVIENLKQAIELYPKLKEDLKTDPDFDAIREDERFKQLING
jgi:tetratricopeptide (TPR) repeat protein